MCVCENIYPNKKIKNVACDYGHISQIDTVQGPKCKSLSKFSRWLCGGIYNLEAFLNAKRGPSRVLGNFLTFYGDWTLKVYNGQWLREQFQGRPVVGGDDAMTKLGDSWVASSSDYTFKCLQKAAVKSHQQPGGV